MVKRRQQRGERSLPSFVDQVWRCSTAVLLWAGLEMTVREGGALVLVVVPAPAGWRGAFMANLDLDACPNRIWSDGEEKHARMGGTKGAFGWEDRMVPYMIVFGLELYGIGPTQKGNIPLKSGTPPSGQNERTGSSQSIPVHYMIRACDTSYSDSYRLPLCPSRGMRNRQRHI